MARPSMGVLGGGVGGGASVTRSTSIRVQLSREELEHILSVITVVCKMLIALESILKRGIKHAPHASP